MAAKSVRGFIPWWSKVRMRHFAKNFRDYERSATAVLPKVNSQQMSIQSFHLGKKILPFPMLKGLDIHSSRRRSRPTTTGHQLPADHTSYIKKQETRNKHPTVISLELIKGNAT